MVEGVCCQSLYSGQRILCPRAVFLLWRGIWLERAPEGSATLSLLPFDHCTVSFRA